MTVSYKRNRDYSKQFNWTYELKENLYGCYKKAKEDPKLGYMKHTKEYWDDIHPELVFFTERNLREQATRIEKNKTVMATEYSQTQNNNNQIEINNTITNDDTTEGTVIETTVNNVMDNVERNNDSINILRSSGQYNCLRECFITNDNTSKEKSLDERTTATNINKNIDKTLYVTIDIIVKDHLESLELIDYWVLNVSVFTAAYTIKQYVGELKTTAPTQNKMKETPKWIKIFENSIENTRKFIGKLTTVIACKKSNLF